MIDAAASTIGARDLWKKRQMPGFNAGGLVLVYQLLMRPHQ
jgi:hypothetical protein